MDFVLLLVGFAAGFVSVIALELLKLQSYLEPLREPISILLGLRQ